MIDLRYPSIISISKSSHVYLSKTFQLSLSLVAFV